MRGRGGVYISNISKNNDIIFITITIIAIVIVIKPMVVMISKSNVIDGNDKVISDCNSEIKKGNRNNL